jgi:hypothetical protein
MAMLCSRFVILLRYGADFYLMLPMLINICIVVVMVTRAKSFVVRLVALGCQG